MFQLLLILYSIFLKFAPLEASYTAEVPEVPYAPNLMPLFRRQYENNIFTGNTAVKKTPSHY